MKETLCPNCKQYKFGNHQGIKLASFGIVILIITAVISSIEWFYTSADLIKFSYMSPVYWGLGICAILILLSFMVKKQCDNCHYTDSKKV